MSDAPAPASGRGWAYLGTVLGGALSIAANIAHTYLTNADPDALSVAVSVFWPVALFVCVEMLARVQWPAGRRYALARSGIAPVALVAGIVSYRHLSGLLTHYGEDGITAALGPLAVDGLMLMSTAALIATRRSAAASAAPVASPTPAPVPTPAVVPAPAPLAPRPAVVPVGVRLLPLVGAPQTAEEDEPVDLDTLDEDEAAESASGDDAEVIILPVRPQGRRTAEETRKAYEALIAAEGKMSQEEAAKRLGVKRRTLRDHLARTEPATTSAH
ncbi:DUF2637 domain-containing protein [Micromonospora sp. NPDC023956]|uniref:DUF2637 domain-containing protein n=1 Tax=Micromonospora sp. NPDC023956 TaxID=3155722 RepID=UPI0033F1BE4F